MTKAAARYIVGSIDLTASLALPLLDLSSFLASADQLADQQAEFHALFPQ